VTDQGGEAACALDRVCRACGGIGCECTRAVVAFPTGDGLASIEAHRQREDPLVGRIAAHVTLVFPFRDDLRHEVLADHVRRAVAHVAPFELVLDEVDASADHVMLVASAGAAEATRLHDALYSGPLDHHLLGLPFIPHVTVGRGPDDGTAAALAPARLRVSDIAIVVVPATGRVLVDEVVPLS
jgi:2'-5' RNA ligase